jgi:transposase
MPGNLGYFVGCVDPRPQETECASPRYNKLLALQGALISQVAFGANAVIVRVRKRAKRLRCPYCHFSCRARYDRKDGEWQHLSLGR